ncbi:MAG: hydantoinase/oxoprolinase [Candidatus Eremiobacteraeota bacterium]|nr:hydantoinase/oxoprolinase [Candidatus Eremiobacteraeota bacterium]
MNSAPSRVRVGVDVGGTFTDVVAIDSQSRELRARFKVATTHGAPEGVAAGIVAGIQRLVNESDIEPHDVSFIAHSTTQATNSLLEGDVAKVAVIGLLDRFGALARTQIALRPFDLAPGAKFSPITFFTRDDAATRKAIEDAVQRGVGAIAVSEPFSVDRPAREEDAIRYARARGIAATGGHEVSSMYGLRARTRTAALNAAILPKMMQTAQMTNDAVQRASITAPLMIMRSDGGVMNLREVQRRPIMTLLSGPAAGVAGALLHENVTDGIFIEVGGTSADCSAIRNGMPQMRPARVGGHRTMLRTLDVRTLGIAGGSMLRASRNGITDVGPRSAHIAGLHYAAFSEPHEIAGSRPVSIAPMQRDPADYVCLENRSGVRIALTVTCAANVLGVVPRDAFAQGNADSATRAFEIAGAFLGMDARELARGLLDVAANKLLGAVRELTIDYELDPANVVIVGGGGGSGAIVPYAAQRFGADFRLARDAEVISPIGVALALVRDVVERTIVAPSPKEIMAVRREAEDAAIASGAAPDKVDVAIEIDAQRNLVRAIASGASELADQGGHRVLSADELRAAVARVMRGSADQLRSIEATRDLTVFTLGRQLGRRSIIDLRVVDRNGVARAGMRDAVVTQTTAGEAETDLTRVIEEQTAFGDVGRALPQIYILHGAKVTDLSGLASATQVVALAVEDLSGLAADAPVCILTSKNRA